MPRNESKTIEVKVLVGVGADGEHAVSADPDDFEAVNQNISDANQPIDFFRVTLKVPRPQVREISAEVPAQTPANPIVNVEPAAAPTAADDEGEG